MVELPVFVLLTGHRKINEMYKMTAKSFRVMGYWLLWRLPLDGGHFLVQGRNELSVCLLSRDAEVSEEHHTHELRDVEVRKRRFLVPFSDLNRSFTKPGSGQNVRNT